MSISQQTLVEHLDVLLNVSQFKDYGPNGLQVEGKSTIKHIVVGVTACQALIDAAAIKKADAIIVHHGLFWQGEPQPIMGVKKNRLKLLLENDINLFGYHLPLDCHETLGNNAQISQLVPLVNTASHCIGGVNDLLWTAQLTKPQRVDELQAKLDGVFGRQSLYLGNDASAIIENIAWCSGAAQKYIVEAKQLGADLYFSGEVSEQTMHQAKEYDIHYLACGHHATERYGIKALAKHLEEKFSISTEFIDINNPV